jgi:hypothetical protein
MKKLISKVLHEAQEDAPIGQSWNLHSEAACDQLAEKVADKLDSQIHHLPSKKVFVRVDVIGSILEDVRVFRTKPIDLGDTSNIDGSFDERGFKVFEIELED